MSEPAVPAIGGQSVVLVTALDHMTEWGLITRIREVGESQPQHKCTLRIRGYVEERRKRETRESPVAIHGFPFIWCRVFDDVY